MAQAWTPVYWADYLADTGHLSLAEHGAYLMLMAHYYSKHKPLPANAMQLHRICRAFADAEMHAVDTVIDEFFYLDGDVYRNKRIDEELDKATQLTEKRRKAANNRWGNTEKEPEKGSGEGDASAMQVHTQSQSQYKEKDLSKDKSKKKVSEHGTRLSKDWVIPDDWLAWARRERPEIDPMVRAQNFKDYWIAVPGQKGRKADWFATWRNNVRDTRFDGRETHQRSHEDNSAPARVQRAQERRDRAEGRTFEHKPH